MQKPSVELPKQRGGGFPSHQGCPSPTQMSLWPCRLETRGGASLLKGAQLPGGSPEEEAPRTPHREMWPRHIGSVAPLGGGPAQTSTPHPNPRTEGSQDGQCGPRRNTRSGAYDHQGRPSSQTVGSHEEALKQDPAPEFVRSDRTP